MSQQASNRIALGFRIPRNATVKGPVDFFGVARLGGSDRFGQGAGCFGESLVVQGDQGRQRVVAEAQTVIAAMDGKDLDGRNLTVNEAKPRAAGGGGRGGGGGGGGGRW